MEVEVTYRPGSPCDPGRPGGPDGPGEPKNFVFG